MYKPVIGAANQKGGVGKTTTIKMICEYLARYQNKNMLELDMDSQCSLTARHLGFKINPVTKHKEPPIHEIYDSSNPQHKDWDGKSSIADIFYGQLVVPYSTRIKNLDICPADEAKLLAVDEVKRQELTEKVYNRLHQFITLKDLQDSYDAFGIDTPPAKGSLTIASFKAMTHLIIPLEMERQAIEGLQGILTLWKQESLQRPKDYPLKLIGILASKYHSRRSHDKKKYDELRTLVGEENIIPIKICDRTQYPELDDRNMSVFDLPDSDDAKKEALALGEYIAKRIYG